VERRRDRFKEEGLSTLLHEGTSDLRSTGQKARVFCSYLNLITQVLVFDVTDVPQGGFQLVPHDDLSRSLSSVSNRLAAFGRSGTRATPRVSDPSSAPNQRSKLIRFFAGHLVFAEIRQMRAPALPVYRRGSGQRRTPT
jgi:hypothetical protein